MMGRIHQDRHCHRHAGTVTREAGGGKMALRLFEPNLETVKPDLRRLYIADAEHGFRLDLILKGGSHLCAQVVGTARSAIAHP